MKTKTKQPKPLKLTAAQKRLIAKGLLQSYLGLDPEWPSDNFDEEMVSMLREVEKACKVVGL